MVVVVVVDENDVVIGLANVDLNIDEEEEKRLGNLHRHRRRKRREVRHLRQHRIALPPLPPLVSFCICVSTGGGRGGSVSSTSYYYVGFDQEESSLQSKFLCALKGWCNLLVGLLNQAMLNMLHLLLTVKHQRDVFSA
ncbi:hypothetical protein B296_00037606 [Ensete ventricosum]|uniref:Uncharacterized protein n=1 Tax=Ensete ventricosum TaxID=4639 RepID=A0A426ZZ27_ENSVE|nr:hypothetical protein B296_00037606 [Ensete ventricosum]